MQHALKTLFFDHFGEPATAIQTLQGDGSDRRIFRLTSVPLSVIGIHGTNFSENEAFVSFTRHFERFGLPVPHIFAYNADHDVYLESDLGDQTLFDWMNIGGTLRDFESRRREVYRRVIEFLPRFQIEAGRTIDYSRCYQTQAFDAEAMLRDLLYFQHSFLRRFAQRPFDANALLHDFKYLIARLLEEPADFFLYRDFQSRNIMVQAEQLYFIDYQSGRRGALQYDLASLLYDAYVELPQPLCEELLELYIDKANSYTVVRPSRFKHYFNDFALLRVLQALAAFSRLSFEKGKTHFLDSIPNGLANLKSLINKSIALEKMSTLREIIDDLQPSTAVDRDVCL